MPAPSDWHVTQEHPNWCVPACVCIVQRARGAPASQESVAKELGAGSRRGFELEAAARVVGGTYLACDPSAASYLQTFRVYLSCRKLIIVQVFASEIDALCVERDPTPESPHGRLCVSPYGQLHAIVLVAHEGRRFHYLDPFFERENQPFTLAVNDFVEAFQGACVVADRSPAV